MKRPTRCEICKKQMFYNNHPEWEPEIRLAIAETSDYMFEHPKVEIDYAHERCAKPIMDLIEKLKGKLKGK